FSSRRRHTVFSRDWSSDVCSSDLVVGNIYKGKVQRVMPGMQAAFVEIGLERAAFLHASDVMRSLPTPEIAGDEEAPPAQPQPVRSEERREGTGARCRARAHLYRTE